MVGDPEWVKAAGWAVESGRVSGTGVEELEAVTEVED